MSGQNPFGEDVTNSMRELRLTRKIGDEVIDENPGYSIDQVDAAVEARKQSYKWPVDIFKAAKEVRKRYPT